MLFIWLGQSQKTRNPLCTLPNCYKITFSQHQQQNLSLKLSSALSTATVPGTGHHAINLDSSTLSPTPSTQGVREQLTDIILSADPHLLPRFKQMISFKVIKKPWVHPKSETTCKKELMLVRWFKVLVRNNRHWKTIKNLLRPDAARFSGQMCARDQATAAGYL